MVTAKRPRSQIVFVHIPLTLFHCTRLRIASSDKWISGEFIIIIALFVTSHITPSLFWKCAQKPDGAYQELVSDLL